MHRPKEVVRPHRLAASCRVIARQLRMSRNTIKRDLEREIKP